MLDKLNRRDSHDLGVPVAAAVFAPATADRQLEAKAREEIEAIFDDYDDGVTVGGWTYE